ncbi:MAG: ATP-binding protein [Nanoarchaeota archaeon]|nr:ATP-binding protein [Nanoarchaeota archaeon]
MISAKKIIENPFYSIAHKGDEKIIMPASEIKKIKDLAKKVCKNNILFVVGEPGSGKSLVEKELEKAIPKNYGVRKLLFTVDLLNELRALPSEVVLRKKKFIVFIDKFELSDVVDDKKLKKILDVISETSKAGVGFVISCLPQTLARVFEISDELKKSSIVYNVPRLTYEQAKMLVISRLNSVRKKKSNSIEPFTEHELKSIWRTSNGNPRMILLLCANIYENKKSD